MTVAARVAEEMGVKLGVLTIEAQSLVVAGALLSITLNPLAFRLCRLRKAA